MMDEPTADPPLALVVIAGPQASGKSTIAGALRTELIARGERVVLVELDAIAAMALPTLPSWEAAHRIFASVVAHWATTSVTCVIAEGSGSSDEVEQLRSVAPAGSAVVVAAVTTSLDIAVTRAQADATRGISRERSFLAGVYDRWPVDRATMAADVVVDTGAESLDGSVAMLRAAIEGARLRRRGSGGGEPSQ